MHPLKQYLQDIDEPLQDFARRVGASRQTLYRIISGVQAPKPALARRIVEATGSAVAFEQLYVNKDQRSDIANLKAANDVDGLDRSRLKLVLAIVLNHLLPTDLPGSPEELAEVAAEAVLNTYAALSTVTTRQGPDRLQQALRPVLEEILREFAGRPPPTALDQGTGLAMQLYFQSE